MTSQTPSPLRSRCRLVEMDATYRCSRRYTRFCQRGRVDDARPRAMIIIARGNLLSAMDIDKAGRVQRTLLATVTVIESACVTLQRSLS